MPPWYLVFVGVLYRNGQLSMARAMGVAGYNRNLRNLDIDSLRGVALLLMVAGHVIGSTASSGMNVQDDSLWRYYYISLEDIRMPLFAALSGYVYAYRFVPNLAGYPRLLIGKARRLLVPLVTVGTIFFMTQLVVPDVNQRPHFSDLWKVYVYGTGHFWFVLAMFLIFLTVGILDALGATSRGSRSALICLVTFGLSIFVSVPSAYSVFAFNGFLTLLPFFLLGYCVNRYRDFFTGRWVLMVSLCGFVAAYVLRITAVVTNAQWSSTLMQTLSVLVGLFGILVLLSVRRHIGHAALAWIGKYSFTVYLLHVFGSAGCRVLLAKVGIENDMTVFLSCMLCAVWFPIIFERLFGRVSWISWGILGQRPRGGQAAGFKAKRLAA